MGFFVWVSLELGVRTAHHSSTARKLACAPNKSQQNGNPSRPQSKAGGHGRDLLADVKHHDGAVDPLEVRGQSGAS